MTMTVLEIEKAARYSVFEGKESLEGYKVQEIVDTLLGHHEEILNESKQEYESKLESIEEELDKYHSELSDRHTDIISNIREYFISKLDVDDYHFLTNELSRIETDIFFHL